jgi:hypothetical protein
MLAEKMFRSMGTELVQAQSAILGIDLKLVRRNGIVIHHGALAGTKRTIATQSFLYFIARKCKLHCATMTTAMVLFRHADSFTPERDVILQ